jgi:hypothetical protein
MLHLQLIDRFIGSAPNDHSNHPIVQMNYSEYSTGAGDLFVHLFTGIHLVELNGPTRIVDRRTQVWKDGRDVPDAMLGLYDYPETKNHPHSTCC